MRRLKSIFKNNPILYRIWFYLNKHRLSKSLRLPKPADNFYFDGYTRSGNTYFRGLLKKLYPNLKSASHLHTIAGLKIALDSGLKSIVIIRRPKNAVVSNLYTKVNTKGMKEDYFPKLIDELIAQWIEYYRFARKQKVKIIVFEELIDNKLQFIEAVNNYLKLDEVEELDLLNEIENFDLIMKEKEIKKDDHASALPNKAREVFKRQYLKEVESANLYKEAENIYKEIISP